MSVYDEMVAACAARGLPRHFPTDLTVHDRRSVTEHRPGRPFAWLLYDHGTHLVWLDPRGPGELGDRNWEARKILRTVRECFTGGDHQWFVSDGQTLTATSYDALSGRVAA